MAVDVFGDHDAAIHHQSGDEDGGEDGHVVDGEVGDEGTLAEPHERRAAEDRQGDGEADEQAVAEAHEEPKGDEDQQGAREGVGPELAEHEVDLAGLGADDADARALGGVGGLEAGHGVLDGVAGLEHVDVGACADEEHDRLFPAVGRQALDGFVAHADVGDVGQEQGPSVALAQGDIADGVEVAELATGADAGVGPACALDGAAGGVEVGAGDGLLDLAVGEAVHRHAVGIDLDLDLFLAPAEGVHAGHAVHLFDEVFEPFGDAAAMDISRAPGDEHLDNGPVLEGDVVDHRAGVALGEEGKLRLHAVDQVRDAASSFGDVHGVVEDEGHHRGAVHRLREDAPLILEPVERVLGDLVLHLADDLGLVVGGLGARVGHGHDDDRELDAGCPLLGHREHRRQPGQAEQRGAQQHQAGQLNGAIRQMHAWFLAAQRPGVTIGRRHARSCPCRSRSRAARRTTGPALPPPASDGLKGADPRSKRPAGSTAG